ncbi:hypothetical protein [Catellatospora sp. NPDC049609]|uniref:hypothetical protein n=1 Tax=Catellatospora sp. NPDC049609 TaxID=3155505 RepID=UPI00342B8E50
MNPTVLLNVFSYVAGLDFTGYSNETQFQPSRAALPRTTFRSGGNTELWGGLRSLTYSQAGLWHAGGSTSVDAEAFNSLGSQTRLHTFGPDEAEGSVAYFWTGGHFQYAAFDAPVGQLAPFRLTGQGTDRFGVVRGKLAASPNEFIDGVATPVVTDSLGPLGSAVQLGAVAADEFLYAAVHLLDDVGAGDDITLTIESDSAANFPSPTVRATLGPLSARGGTWLTPVAGAITDTWWRFVVDDITAATSGEFVIGAAFGVQKG